MFETIILMMDATIRVSTPLLLACLAGLYSERSGVVDIGLEGKMLGAAFGAGAVAYITANAWLGLLAGISVSVLLSLLHGFASISNRGNQIVSGVAINFLAAGLTALLGQTWFRQGGRTPSLPDGGRFTEIVWPFAEQVRNIPFIGPFYAEVLSGHKILVYVAFLAVPLTWWILFRTRFGLRLRAVGENPAAVDTAGISVVWMRYRAVIACGILCGVAGSYLSIAVGSGFGVNMTAGQGFMALAALIFAKWKPVSAMFTCLLFGFLDAAGTRLQGVEIWLIGEVPLQVFQALPYVLTVVLLAGFIGKAIPPKAAGIPYLKERS
ncbi:ABC transporter permease [Labrenzia sp. DG1229]|uniref:ABC transporter permease n=1 Tax=Labrenzia sp. DG1229 TaxID=681847 RepID=UPI0004911494|nr:ABC transporter permease [Labrenzia sp. DG1229]